jgi:hypothetical protein
MSLLSRSHGYSMKMAVFRDISPCSVVKLTDISEVITASVTGGGGGGGSKYH